MISWPSSHSRSWSPLLIGIRILEGEANRYHAVAGTSDGAESSAAEAANHDPGLWQP
jgi:hypothetical protein